MKNQVGTDPSTCSPLLSGLVRRPALQIGLLLLSLLLGQAQAQAPKTPARGVVPAQAVAPAQPPVRPVPEVVPDPAAVRPIRRGGIGRLERLPGVPGPLGTTPIPDKKTLEEYGRFVEEFVDPRNVLDLIVGRPRLMRLKDVPTQTLFENAELVELRQLNPKEISLLGKRIGTTVLYLWFKDPKNPGQEKILSYLVRVLPDPEEKKRIEAVYEQLGKEISKLFPDSLVHIKLVGDKIVVGGQAKDILEGTKILQIVRANAPNQQQDENRRTDATSIPVQPLNLIIPPNVINAPGGLPTLADFRVAGGPNVINLLKVPGEQQVMLRVTVAEINRAAARSIGLNFNITNNNGVTVFNQRTGNIASGGSGLISQAASGGGAGLVSSGIGGLLTNNLPITLDNGGVSIAVNALRTMNYAKSLAEPVLVAINGQTASFQAGGQFPVPVIGGGGFGGAGGFGGGSNLQGVNFIPFGVQLNFTPFITDKDRIRLSVAAEVSTRNLATGTNIGGAAVAGLNSRNFQTTVELREGQTLAVAGLIQNNSGADSSRVPLFGDLPFIGRAFAFDRIQTGEQELVVLITPELVSPLEQKNLPGVPGSDVFEPGDLEFYVHGRLESRRSTDYRSPVRTDIHRIAAYRRCEEAYIIGPSGHSKP